MKFVGANLRLARLFHGFTLAELGETLGCSKQFLSRIENGAEAISSQLERTLVDHLKVLPEFFYSIDLNPIADEQCHFRKQLTTKVALRQVARARGELLKRLVNVLDDHLELPTYRMIESEATSNESTERGAEKCRALWGLGTGPLSNLTRIAENAGAVVMRVQGLANEIDAVSFATRRPLIALNADGRSACRGRFAIAHELGHFALHVGVMTGDRMTESQANRFASALLMPRSTFAVECRKAIRGVRLNWEVLSQLKLRWGVSKSAILYRGRQLDIFAEEQVRGGYITLKRHGEAVRESEDESMEVEQPEVIVEGLEVMRSHYGIPEPAIARSMFVQPRLLRQILGDQSKPETNNVISMFTSDTPPQPSPGQPSTNAQYELLGIRD